MFPFFLSSAIICDHLIARQGEGHTHRLSIPSVPNCSATADLPGIRQALNAARHLMEMYRRHLSDVRRSPTFPASADIGSTYTLGER